MSDQEMMCPRCGSRNIEVETLEGGVGPYPDRMLVTKRCLDCWPAWRNTA